jgi:hypothetical protein
MGHRISAKNRNMKVVVFCILIYSGWGRVSHNIPSVSCWTPKMSGMHAKRCCEEWRVFITHAIPIAVRPIPAEKLEIAEKHMCLGF